MSAIICVWSKPQRQMSRARHRFTPQMKCLGHGGIFILELARNTAIHGIEGSHVMDHKLSACQQNIAFSLYIIAVSSFAVQGGLCARLQIGPAPAFLCCRLDQSPSGLAFSSDAAILHCGFNRAAVMRLRCGRVQREQAVQ